MKKFAFLLVFVYTCVFAVVNPFSVKTQAEVDAIEEANVKARAQKVLNIRNDPAFAAVDSYEKAVNVVKKYDSVYMTYIALMLEFEKYADVMYADPNCTAFYKLNYIDKFSKPLQIAFFKTDTFIEKMNYFDLAKIGVEKVTKMAVAMDPTDAKAILKKMNLVIYPKIGDDEKWKPLAVKIKLTLDALD